MTEAYIKKHIFDDPEIVDRRICELEQYLEDFPEGMLAGCFRNELTCLKALYERIA